MVWSKVSVILAQRALWNWGLAHWITLSRGLGNQSLTLSKGVRPKPLVSSFAPGHQFPLVLCLDRSSRNSNVCLLSVCLYAQHELVKSYNLHLSCSDLQTLRSSSSLRGVFQRTLTGLQQHSREHYLSSQTSQSLKYIIL